MTKPFSPMLSTTISHSFKSYFYISTSYFPLCYIVSRAQSSFPILFFYPTQTFQAFGHSCLSALVLTWYLYAQPSKNLRDG